MTFEKHEKNPVIAHPPAGCRRQDFRDPKVWQARRCMVYGMARARQNSFGKAALYRSKNLIDWEYFNVAFESVGDYGYMFECPDIYPLGDKHVLSFSPMGLGERKTVYIVGDMDYRTGKLSLMTSGEMDWGFDYYAPQSFLDNRGRRIIIGLGEFMGLDAVVEGFWSDRKGQLVRFRTVFRAKVRMDPDHKLSFHPIDELTSLRSAHRHVEKTCITGEWEIDAEDGASCELKLVIDREGTTASGFWLKLRAGEGRATSFLFDLAKGELTADRNNADGWSKGIKKCTLEYASHSQIEIHVFMDTTSIELFTDQYRTVMSLNVFAAEGQKQMYLMPIDGTLCISSADTWKLEGVWQ